MYVIHVVVYKNFKIKVFKIFGCIFNASGILHITVILPEGPRIAGDKCICILATRTAVLTATRVRSKI